MDDTPTRFDQVAAQLAANGYRPVPIVPGEKFPPMKEWPQFVFAPGDEKKYPGHGAGIVTRETAGADIDVNDPDAAAAVEAAIREILGIGELAEIPRRIGQAPRVLLPLRCATPFAKIKTAGFRMRCCPEAKLSHVEVLCDGQQFVAYGIHKDTHRPYTWNGAGDLLSVPRDQLPEITEAQAREIVRQSEMILEEWGERVTEAKDDKTHGATPGETIPEGARNDALFRIACRAKRAGLSDDAIVAALFAENQRCNPPLPEHEVRTLARSAVHGATEAPVDDTELDAEDLLVAEFRPLRVVVPDIIIDGLTILAAKPKLGKTWFAVALALASGNGGDFLRHRIEPGAALLVALEDSDRRLQARMRKLVRILGSPKRGALRIRHAWPRGVEGAAKLDAYAEANPSVRVAIFDTYRGLAVRRGRGDLVAEDYEIVVAYQRVAHRRGLALVIVMHERKTIDGADFVDAIAGTHGLTAAADALLVLRRARGEDTATLSVTGRDIEHDGELGLHFDREHGLWTVEGTAAEVMARAERQEVMQVLRIAGAVLTQKEIGEAVERTHGRTRSKQALSKLVNAMVRDGLIVADKGGGYALPSH